MEKIRKFFSKPLKNIVKQRWQMFKTPVVRMRMSLGIQPLSYLVGHDRGLPILRYYSERFFEEFATDIKGHCLEFQEPSYISKYGADRVDKIDIIHIDNSNHKATIVADLTKPNHIPSDQFDCIICTFVLHLVPEINKFIAEIYRILKPGGVLLIIVPHISMCVPKFGNEFWRFTSEGLSLVLAKSFSLQNINIRAYGNSLTAAGNIRGLVAAEFSKAELGTHDPRFASLACARAVK